MSVVPESSGVLVASKVPEVAVPCANQFLTLQNMEDLVSEVDRTEQGLPVDLGSSSSGLGVQGAKALRTTGMHSSVFNIRHIRKKRRQEVI
ncbi:hypothetical protein RHGRI_013588 [Rhododendron griersonianum]|uniref:Uncharacterized protein n=1 Tax=Rhododendron griersonianum TaxID=479676 RepID=A0AAV6K6A6_9ERIC|nr:hypothetical protein RHGRI_013430 [Rhododendron griersonianum]KAG5547950.1 hypothetical protein RHGRI_013588 [Rhododendron griersonianum]